jgi:hypothetical protein
MPDLIGISGKVEKTHDQHKAEKTGVGPQRIGGSFVEHYATQFYWGMILGFGLIHLSRTRQL